MRALPRPTTGRPTRGRHQRGFTLLEMMAVLGMIAVLAALATPSFVKMMDDRRSWIETSLVADAFRTGRARSLGRGGAVKVALGTSPASASILEHVTDNSATSMPMATCRGLNEGCSAADCVGVAGCSVATPGDVCWKKVADVVGRGGTDFAATVTNDTVVDNVPLAPVTVCFTPRGRTYYDTNGGGFDVLNGVVEVQEVGGPRSVIVQGNGQTRIRL